MFLDVDCESPELFTVEWFNLFTLRADSPADAQTIITRYQRRKPPANQGIELRPVLSADLNYVFEASVGHQ
jgi:hypothetical protein